MDSKSVKRKAEEISNESEAEEISNNGPSRAADNSILGLCDDIVLGEVITQMPWYNRPVCMLLSRWWADAMTNSFPYYARLQNPRILSKSLVLFHTPDPEYLQYNSFCIWVYFVGDVNEGNLVNVPVPSVPENLRSDVKFVVDDNDERIYSFTPVHENGQNTYDVSVVDLREGNFQWKKLPPSPFLEGQFVVSFSSFDDGGSCTTYHIRIDDHDDEEHFSVWTLDGRNNISAWQPELGGSPAVIDRVIGFHSEEPPKYLEITIPSEFGGQPLKCLYEMCEHSEYHTDDRNSVEQPEFLLLQFEDGEDDRRSGQRTTNYNSSLYYISAFEGEGVRKLSFYKLKLNDENSSRIEQESEWNVFWHTWIPAAFSERVEVNAKKVASEMFSEWGEGTFNIDNGVDIEAIKLAPKGALYVYSLLARLW